MSARFDREPVLRLGALAAVPVRRRTALVGLVLLLLVAVAAAATLSMGLLAVPLREVPGVFFGHASPASLRVYDLLTGPRLSVAIGAGAALGISGALFQSVSRNPLGSPDVIGVSAGAGAGAAFVALHLPGVSVPLGSVVGAGLAIGLVAISTGSGLANPMKMVLAGIGVSAAAMAFTQYVVYVADREESMSLSAYLNGSLGARGWDHASTIWTVLMVCAVPLALLSTPLGLTEMGDDVAASLGVDGAATRRWAVVLSVVLAGGAVAVVGPVAFIALTAPHITRRLARSARPLLLLSGVMGALLLTAADLVTQQTELFKGLPVGILTLAIGGAYLGMLLVGEWRRKS